MSKTTFHSRILRQLAERLIAEQDEFSPDSRDDLTTSLVRQWITYEGNATLFVNEQQFYLTLHKTPLGKPFVSPDLDWGSEDSITLGEIVAEGHETFSYTYDMGDHWEHLVKIEKTLPGKPSVRYPRCAGGKRACPPEDCGGVPGYQEFIRAICDPEHEEHSEMLEWVGGQFDPTAFDREEINRELRRVK